MTAWTAEEDAILNACWKSGMSARQIGPRVKKSRNAVIGRLHRLRLQDDPTRPRRVKVKKEQPRMTRSYRKAAPASAPVLTATPLPPEPPVPQGTLQLIDLEPHHCRYVFGDTRAEHGFCGCNVVQGLPYCEEHARLCYVTPVPTGKPYIPQRYLGTARKRKLHVAFEEA